MKSSQTSGPWIRKGEQVWNEDEVMYVAAKNFDIINSSQTLEANARLIAAAPELLVALYHLLDMVTDSRTHGPEIDLACAALAKATKEQGVSE